MGLQRSVDQLRHLATRVVIDYGCDSKPIQVLGKSIVSSNLGCQCKNYGRRLGAIPLVREQNPMHLHDGYAVLLRKIKFEDQEIKPRECQFGQRRFSVWHLHDSGVLGLDHRAQSVTHHAALMRD